MRWFLFATKLGDLVLRLLERHAGLAVVQAEWLAAHRSGRPTKGNGVQDEPQPGPQQ